MSKCMPSYQDIPTSEGAQCIQNFESSDANSTGNDIGVAVI